MSVSPIPYQPNYKQYLRNISWPSMSNESVRYCSKSVVIATHSRGSLNNLSSSSLSWYLNILGHI